MKRWSVFIKWVSKTGKVVERTLEVDEFCDIDAFIERGEDWIEYPHIQIELNYNTGGR